MPRGGAGRARGILGVSRGLPGRSRGALLHSPGPPLKHLFLSILGGILASFWLLFGSLNRPRGALDAKRSIFKTLCFTYVNPYFSSLRGPRGSQNRSRERLENSIRFFTEFCIQNDTKLALKSVQKGARIVTKSLRKSIKNLISFVHRFWEPKWTQNSAQGGVRPGLAMGRKERV